MPISSTDQAIQIERDIREARAICMTERAAFDERLALPDIAKHLGDALRIQHLKPEEWYGFITETLPAQREQLARKDREWREQKRKGKAAAKRAARPKTKTKRKRKWHPPRDEPTTRHIIQIDFSDVQASELEPQLHVTVRSIWEVGCERNDLQLKATGKYFTYDTARAWYAVWKQEPDLAWWGNVPSELGRTTMRNLVKAHMNFTEDGCRNYRLLQQKSTRSYRFVDVKRIQVGSTPNNLPIYAMALQVPFLGEVKLKPKDRYQAWFMQRGDFEVRSARIWQSPRTGVWYCTLHYPEVGPRQRMYRIAHAFRKLWQPDMEFLATRDAVAALNEQGFDTHDRELTAIVTEWVDAFPKRLKVNGVPVRGFWLPKDDRTEEDRAADDAMYELLYSIDEPEPTLAPFKRRQLPSLLVAQPRKRLPPVQLAQPVVSPNAAAIHAKLAQLKQEYEETDGCWRKRAKVSIR